MPGSSRIVFLKDKKLWVVDVAASPGKPRPLAARSATSTKARFL